ncbi:MAG: hypothetical protein IKB87_05100 [Clostridia bacterium]|nr:hypothetical protein [Clostridia bacterium]
MNSTNKKEPWKIVVFTLSVAFIVFMWVKKDITAIYAKMPSEDILPLFATTVAVSLLKVAAIAGAVLLIKWIVGKVKKK